MTPKLQVQEHVAYGSTGENLWVSYSPGLGSHAGNYGGDASSQTNSETQSARALAAASQSHRDRDRNSDGKRSRRDAHNGQGKGAKGDGQVKGHGKKSSTSRLP